MRSNLTSQKRSTLKKLVSDSDLVIEPFHKGSEVWLIDISFHISKIEKLLTDPLIYNELNSDPTQAIRNDLLSTIIFTTRWIDYETRQHLAPRKPICTPLFCGLPNIHKSNIPLQPIISACKSSTNQLSNYMSHFIQPLEEILRHSSRTGNTFYSSFNPFLLCLRMKP